MPAPLIALAAGATRKVLVRRLVRFALVVAPVVVAGVVCAALLVVMVFTGETPNSVVGVSGGSCAAVVPAGQTTVAGLGPQQLANAATIVAVGRQARVPAYGWVIAIAAAMQESGLNNLGHGDRDSLGLFQQRAGWGSADQRLDPSQAARMFYTGGANGIPGLLQVPGWQQMPVTVAAQAVQHSAFPDAYARWQGFAEQVVSSPDVLSAVCYSATGYPGDGSAGAAAVSAALRFVGTPYSWGGGGLGGPTLGMPGGPGADTVGFDCSSLVQYAWFQAAGLALPRVTDAQAAALPHVPAGDALQAGDLLFFHAPSDPVGSYHHVGLYDGLGNMVHAPRTGKTVEVVHDVFKDPYFSAQFAFAARPVPGTRSKPGVLAGKR